MTHHGLARGGRTRDRLSDERPVVHPAHGLQVHDAAVGTGAVEVREPGIAIRRFDVATLVRSLHPGITLREHGTHVVRPPDIARAQHGLRAFLHSAIWREDVVPAVALEEFRSLEYRQVDRVL